MSGARRISGPFGETAAQTHPAASDPEMRGRTYAEAFDDVWEAAIWLANGGLRGCRLRRANDRDGIIIAEARSRLIGISDFTVSVVLDADAQTRVDASSASRDARADFGTNARRIRTFFRLLEERLVQRLGHAPVSVTPRQD